MSTRGKGFKGSYQSYLLIYFFSYFSMAAFSSVLSVYLTESLGKNSAEMSLIVSAAGIFSFPVIPLMGYICDKLKKPRQISVVLLLLMGLFSIVFAFCRSVFALFLLNGLVMSFYNSTMPVSERLAGASSYRYGVLRVWGTFGYAAGAQTAGIAIQSLPSAALFIIVAAAAGLAALGYFGAEDPGDIKAEEKGKKLPLSSLLKNGQFLLFLLLVFLVAGCSGANMTYVPVMLSGLGVPTSAVGTVLFFSTLVEIPIIVFSNRFMDRFSTKLLLRLCICLFIVQYISYGLASAVWVAVAVVVAIKAIASTLLMMLYLKAVRNLISSELTTTGLSITNSITSLGTITMQNVGGLTVELVGIKSFYLILSALMALSLVMTFFLKIRNDQKIFS